jgi:hypothetical protein
MSTTTIKIIATNEGNVNYETTKTHAQQFSRYKNSYI